MFFSELVISTKRGTKNWVVEEPLIYISKFHGPITVPVGYETDLASVPRIVWSIIRPDDPTVRRAAVIHDYIYTNLTNYITKKEADDLFHVMLLEDCTYPLKARVMWCAVRVGGRGNW